MSMLWKGAVAVSLTVASLGAAVVPAQAQYYGYNNGWRDGRDYRSDRRWDRGRHWDNRRHWRGDNRRHYRQSYRGYRQHCWTEWRYSRYADRRVRVRICR